MKSSKVFRVSTVDGVLVIELIDIVSSLADDSITNEFEVVRARLHDDGFEAVVIDLGNVAYFGSSMLEAIRTLWNALAPSHRRLVLCNASEVGREILRVTKFDQTWPLVATRADALQLLKTSGSLLIPHRTAELNDAIARYASGYDELRTAVEGLTVSQLRAKAAPGRWSVLEVVCHIADFDLVYADRMKRVVAEDRPTLFGGDPDRFAASLAYNQRDLEEELELIAAVRRHVTRFLRTLDNAAFERIGVHSVDGPLTLATLLNRIAGHIPHHAGFIRQKRQNLGTAAGTAVATATATN